MDRPGTARRHVLTDRRVSGLHLIYEDDSLLVVNKPAGLLTVSLARRPDEASLYDLVAAYLRPRGKLRPLLVHRIDRDTSGLVLFAKTPQAQAKLKDQFAGQVAERIYRAIVYGHPKPDAGTWRDHLVWDRDYLRQRQARSGDPRAKEAVSHYRVLEQYAEAALVEVQLLTGKRNQIRIQAGLRGHQLVGERKYVFEPAPRQMIKFPRQALHAHRLGFHHPTDDRALSFEAPLPEDFVSLINKLKG
jgi:RluA family pseudouridine synthase